MKKVGVVGTGLLGSAICSRLLDKNYSLSIYNRTIDKTKPFEERGVKVAKSPKEVALDSEFVIILLKDARVVHELSFSENGISDGCHSDLVLADMTTSNPFESARIAKRFNEEKAIDMIDTPVMGGPPLALKGELTAMVGGNRNAFDKAKPVLDDLAKQSFYIGENGAGHKMKLAMNLQISLLALSISEGIHLARKTGLDPHQFLEVLNSTYFSTGMSQRKGPKMADGEYEPTFFLKMMKKDLDTILDTAKHIDTNLNMANLACKIYSTALEKGYGEFDYTGIAAQVYDNENIT